MSRPPFEVADIIRSAGADFIARNRHWLRWTHIKVLLAIARCRTAALGGHIDECTSCGHRATISYNEAFPSTLGRVRDLPERTSSRHKRRSSSCNRILRLVSNASRSEAADASAVRSWRRGAAPGARRGCQSMDFACRAQLSSGTCQPMWSSNHTEADYLPPGISAVSQLPR